jgi:predicted oxidoreductase (fatty acid repression mutant protein)
MYLHSVILDRLDRYVWIAMDSIGLCIRLDHYIHVTVQKIDTVMELPTFDGNRLNITSKFGCI